YVTEAESPQVIQKVPAEMIEGQATLLAQRVTMILRREEVDDRPVRILRGADEGAALFGERDAEHQPASWSETAETFVKTRPILRHMLKDIERENVVEARRAERKLR